MNGRMVTALSLDTILHENKRYWSGRAPGYSEVKRLELSGDQKLRWKSCLREEISRLFPQSNQGGDAR
ncbi:MAG: hypothetical protein J5949_05155 [Oscillospiraceae bacterium]|nr:hypothetical protein [Oscillospiraceae bacterium]